MTCFMSRKESLAFCYKLILKFEDPFDTKLKMFKQNFNAALDNDMSKLNVRTSRPDGICFSHIFWLIQSPLRCILSDDIEVMLKLLIAKQ